jgi:hypothetical protein
MPRRASRAAERAQVRCGPAGAAVAPGALGGGRVDGVPRRLRGGRGGLLRRCQPLLLRLRARAHRLTTLVMAGTGSHVLPPHQLSKLSMVV